MAGSTIAAGPGGADAALVLADRLDLTAAGALAAAIRARRGGPLRLDAGAVAHLGGLCLQVLLAGAADWRARGAGWAIDPRSRAFDRALTVFGVAPDRIGAGPGTVTQAETAEATR